MNNEINKEVIPPQQGTHKNEAQRKKKRKPAKKFIRSSVVYSDDELKEVEGTPFWNAVHDGVIKNIESDGLLVSVLRDGGAITVFIPEEELSAGMNRNIGQSIRVYLNDAILSEANSE